MKKILFLLFVSVCFLASSCSKDEGESTPSYSIVGVWKHYTLEWIWTFNPDKTYTKHLFVDEYEKGETPSYSGTYTFDGKYISFDGGFKKEVIFSEDGNSIKFDGLAYYRYK